MHVRKNRAEKKERKKEKKRTQDHIVAKKSHNIEGRTKILSGRD